MPRQRKFPTVPEDDGTACRKWLARTLETPGEDVGEFRGQQDLDTVARLLLSTVAFLKDFVWIVPVYIRHQFPEPFVGRGRILIHSLPYVFEDWGCSGE